MPWSGHLGFLPWKGRFYNMLLEQLAMGEAVRGIKATERERRSRAAAALAPTVGSAPSLLVSGCFLSVLHMALWTTVDMCTVC